MSLPLQFQAPLGWWLAAGLAPLVLLYILKVRRTRLTVASTYLWAAARREVVARSPFQKLVARVPLVLQALALVLLACALARPSTRHRALLGDHIAVVVDTSASMGASDTPGGPMRMEAAKKAARDALSAVSPGTDVFVVDAGHEARMVTPVDRDVARVVAAIDALSAGDVEGDLGAAVALAADRLRQLGGEQRMVVVTDGALARRDALRSVAVATDVVLVGAPVDNAGIVRVDVREGSNGGHDEVQAFALVVNAGAAARDAYVTLRLAGVDQPLASRRLRLAPGERAPVVLTFAPTPGDRGKGLVFDLAPHDALVADDVAYARVPGGAKQPVVLASAAPSPWLERALASDPLVDLVKGTPDDVSRASVPEDALYVYDGLCPAGWPTGDVLVVAPPPGPCLTTTVGGALEAPSVTSWSGSDPRFRFLTLEGVRVEHARALATEGGAQQLVRGAHETLVADASSSGHTATVVGFDVGDSNWPLKASFVLFVRNVVELARGHRSAGAAGTAHAGEPLRVTLPAVASEATVAPPGGAPEYRVSARAGLALVSDTRRAGHYLVSWPEPHAGSSLASVNLLSERESDLRTRVGSAEFGSGATAVPVARLSDASTDWSFVAAAAALAFLVADVWWLTRASKPRAARPAGGVRVLPTRRLT